MKIIERIKAIFGTQTTVYQMTNPISPADCERIMAVLNEHMKNQNIVKQGMYMSYVLWPSEQKSYVEKITFTDKFRNTYRIKGGDDVDMVMSKLNHNLMWVYDKGAMNEKSIV